MFALRRILGQLGIACLVWQAAAIALPSALLLIANTNCACTTGDNAMCPMHHHGSKSDCALRAAADDNAATLLPLTFVGVLTPSPRALVVMSPAARSVPHHNHGVFSLQIPPEPPPPRA